MYLNLLMVGVDLLSRTWTGPTEHCVLFGDGAGAVFLSASEGPVGFSGSICSAMDRSRGLIIP